MKCAACGHENVEGARFCASCGALVPTHAEGPDPMIGQVVGGRYRITGVIGEGGMGMVYVGEQQMGSTVRKVAVKTLHQHLSKDPAVLARFHRECGTVAQLEHANTIKFYDFGATQDGTLYIAMEFVKGEPLSKLIEQSAMTPERTLKIMRQVCGALDEAHKLGVIHRDLKPDNIILTERAGETDFVKVLDFGIAARTESADAQKEQKLTQQGMVLGTPPYMSPEQFTGKALDGRSDIYSLGVMAYEMLTGKLPFEADTPWQWATQHMTAQPTPFEVSAPSTAVPAPMRRAILKALSKNRDDRQPTVREFYTDLSEGGRMTVDAPVHPGHASTGTAAMAAAPAFDAPGTPSAPGSAPHSPHFVPPTAGMPAMPGTTPGAMGPMPGAMGPMPMHHAMSAGPSSPGMSVVAVPPPPAPRASGGGKGLLFALIGLGGLLLIAIAIVVLRAAKPADDSQTLTNPFTSASAAATIAPQVETAAPVASTGPAATATEAPHVKSTVATTGHPAKTGATASASAAPTAGGATGSAACDACIAAASSGNIQQAANNFPKCTDEAKKNTCRAQARSSAPGAAKAAAFNNDCKRAQAIAAAANAMGASSGALSSATSTCK